jgi:hypothetical protein
MREPRGHVPEPEPPEQEPGDQESVPAEGNPDAEPETRQGHDQRDLEAELHRREGEAAFPPQLEPIGHEHPQHRKGEQHVPEGRHLGQRRRDPDDRDRTLVRQPGGSGQGGGEDDGYTGPKQSPDTCSR